MTKYYAILYVATLAIMLLFDLGWLGVVARDFYKSRLGDSLVFHPLPGVIFYLVYVAGILVFVSGTATQWQSVLGYAAFFGALAYATYDLTNLATLRQWSWPLGLVDIAWGTFNTGVSATIGWLIARAMTR